MSEEEDILAQFRGIPKGYSKEPVLRARPIHELLDKIAKTYNIEQPRIEITIIQNWRDIVGMDKAHRCKPSKIINEHTLLITTTNTTLRMELKFDQNRILKNLQRLCGDDVIRNIVIR